jgi:DNA topoisomerase-3
MLHIVRHFGDVADGGAPCGRCDFCAPRSCSVLTFREPRPAERDAAARLLASLRAVGDRPAGRLRQDAFGEELTPSRYGALLDALVRGGLVEEERDSFERDGDVIDFKRVRLTRRGVLGCDLDRLPFVARDGAGRDAPRPRRRKPIESVAEEPGDAPPETVDALRQWRLDESRRRGVPAYRIFSNRVLVAIAAARPRTESELLAVRGIGPALLDQYGERLLALVRSPGPRPAS